ncbi:MAG: helix-turn-helix domain-containing protein [Acidimicrobiia bacterium]
MLTVMDAAAFVRGVRAQSGLSVRALGAAAGIAASTVHRIEKGEMTPTVELLERLLAATGSELVLNARPDYAASAFGLGRAFRLAIATGDTRHLVRMSAEFARRYTAVDHDAQLRMVGATPKPTGDIRWDSFLAALVEWLCAQARCAPPAWVLDRADPLPGAWWVTDIPALRAWEYAGSPISFRRRGIYLHRESLENV